jgi:DNA (cytosine-5)-methyltransferase 1
MSEIGEMNQQITITMARNCGEISLPRCLPIKIPHQLEQNITKITIKELKKLCDIWGISRKGKSKIVDLVKTIRDYFYDSKEDDSKEDDSKEDDSKEDDSKEDGYTPELVSDENAITVLDLCAGAGGGAMGFRNTGKYKHTALIEISKDCCKTLIGNGFPESVVECADITNIKYTKKYKSDLIVIGSPCQSFSFAGLKKGFVDPRGQILLRFIEMLDDINPEMFLIENVRGLIHHDGGGSLKRLIKALRKKRYFVKYKLLNASHYGVPQKRERIFIFGSKKNDEFEFPTKLDNIPTVGDAIGDLTNNLNNIITQTYNAKKLKYFKKIPQGGCWVNLPVTDQQEYMGASFNSGGGKRGILKRLSYDKPSLTILCSPQQKQTERCHPTQDRPLTVMESARIQTFPDDYKFSGSIASQYKQIGNAIPVKLAQAMAESIYSYWLENREKENDHIPELSSEDDSNEDESNEDESNEDESKEDDSNEDESNEDESNEDDSKEGNEYVNFVSDNEFETLVVELLDRYKKIKKEFNIARNIIDPVKLIFDLHGYNIDEKSWKLQEAIRQGDKTINNAIGYFHQHLLGRVDGWINIDNYKNLRDIYGCDLCNENKSIFIEIKNKYNSMNSGSRRDVLRKIKEIKTNHHKDAALFVGIVNSNSKKTKTRRRCWIYKWFRII